MAVFSRRVVITGIGVVSPIGLDKGQFWDSLCSGRSGVIALPTLRSSQFPVRIGGAIQGFDGKKFLDKKDRKSLKMMSRTIQLAVAAANLALSDSGVDVDSLDRDRFGVEFGAGLIGTELEELAVAAQKSADRQSGKVDLEKWGAEGIPNLQPLWMLKYLPNMLASHVSILHDARGPNNTITENEVAGLLALSEATRIIQRDLADLFLVGGADSRLDPLSFVRHSMFMPLSQRNDSPGAACRPFDQDRDGVVIGEGSGVFVLEELEHARRRRARIYAEVVGMSAGFDRGRTGAGLARVARDTLEQAGAGPEDLDHVNAHGASDIAGDRWEARGVVEILGESSSHVPIFAPSSYMGSLGAGGSTAEMAGSILALHEGVLPPTLNYETPDPDCPVAVIAKQSKAVVHAHVLKVSLTDLGQCACVVLRKW